MKYVLIALIFICSKAFAQNDADSFRKYADAPVGIVDQPKPKDITSQDTVYYKEYGLFKKVKVGIYEVFGNESKGEVLETIRTKIGHLDTYYVKWFQFKDSPYRFYGWKAARNFFIKD